MDIHIWISIYGYPYMDIHIPGPARPGPAGPAGLDRNRLTDGNPLKTGPTGPGPGRPGRPGRAGPGRAGPGIDKQLHNIVYIQFYDRGSLRPRVLEAQVPSVPRSHRSQGPIGPPKVSHPKVSMDPLQGSLGNHIWISIWISIWMSVVPRI